jgi:hypothetical protein
VEQLKVYNEFGSVTEKTLEATLSKHTKIINQHLKIYTGGRVVLCAAGRKRVVKCEGKRDAECRQEKISSPLTSSVVTEQSKSKTLLRSRQEIMDIRESSVLVSSVCSLRIGNYISLTS